MAPPLQRPRRRQRNKSVAFLDGPPRVRRVPLWPPPGEEADWTASARSDVWWNRDDQAAFRARDARILRWLRRHPREADRDRFDRASGESRRGLERRPGHNHLSRNISRLARREGAKSIVLDGSLALDFAPTVGVDRRDRLVAKAYAFACRSARREAIELAASDERYVREEVLGALANDYGRDCRWGQSLVDAERRRRKERLQKLLEEDADSVIDAELTLFGCGPTLDQFREEDDLEDDDDDDDDVVDEEDDDDDEVGDLYDILVEGDEDVDCEEKKDDDEAIGKEEEEEEEEEEELIKDDLLYDLRRLRSARSRLRFSRSRPDDEAAAQNAMMVASACHLPTALTATDRYRPLRGVA